MGNISIFIIRVWLVIIFITVSSCCKKDKIEVVDLRCCNLVNPEGIDRTLFSWKIKTDLSNTKQNSWEIEIANTKEALRNGSADVWKSGRNFSEQQLNIKPQGLKLKAGKGYWWRVRIWGANNNETLWSEPAYFSLGPDSSQWKGKWITSEWKDKSPLPYFRKIFNISKINAQPVRAVIYLSGLGCSDLFFNGNRVDSTRVLDPAQTNYEHYAFYSTFDVTSLLKKENNCIGVMLGNGWYNQDLVWGPNFSYGKPILYVQLDITYSDGSVLTVATDEAGNGLLVLF